MHLTVIIHNTSLQDVIEQSKLVISKKRAVHIPLQRFNSHLSLTTEALITITTFKQIVRERERVKNKKNQSKKNTESVASKDVLLNEPAESLSSFIVGHL
ncbi:hypothetical protein Cni_G17820 [Canna indica]|uniref:Uncharacterized protein n=1 Tax=Canna indica TaxID=4628 RepID=A0AAQ3KJJ0_9LILI|nr:hypothetical protein Cni_G17820 [Canna indica]